MQEAVWGLGFRVPAIQKIDEVTWIAFFGVGLKELKIRHSNMDRS